MPQAAIWSGDHDDMGARSGSSCPAISIEEQKSVVSKKKVKCYETGIVA